MNRSIQPFAHLLGVIDALPEKAKPADGAPLRDHLPGVWPTVGDLRRLVATWKEGKL